MPRASVSHDQADKEEPVSNNQFFANEQDQREFGFAEPGMRHLGITRVTRVGQVTEPATSEEMPLMQFWRATTSVAMGYMFRREGRFYSNHTVTLPHRHLSFALNFATPASSLSVLLVMQSEQDVDCLYVKTLTADDIARVGAKRSGKVSLGGFSKLSITKEGTTMQTWYQQFLGSHDGAYTPKYITVNLSLRQDIYRRLCHWAEVDHAESESMPTPDSLVERALSHEFIRLTLEAERAQINPVVGVIGTEPASEPHASTTPTEVKHERPDELLALRLPFEDWCRTPSVAALLSGTSAERRKQTYVEAVIKAFNLAFDANLLCDYTAEFICELFDRNGVPVVRGFDDASWTPNRVQRLRTKLGAHPRKPPGGRDAA